MTIHDPAMQRLVEVNPAPDGFELPPLSDHARFETVLERGRSERSWSRPVLVRQWRPGLVVAAAAFVVVLVTFGVATLLFGITGGEEIPVVTEPQIATTAVPAPTTAVPSVFDEYEIVISDPGDGSFSTAGEAVEEGLACRGGTIETSTITTEWANWDYASIGAYSDDYWMVEERTLTCGDGSGSIVLGINVYQSHSASGYSFAGEWLVSTGTGVYEPIAGGGDVAGSCDSDRANCSYEFAGRLDRSRNPAAPIDRSVQDSTTYQSPGRYDVTIGFEGSGVRGTFHAEGSAVSAGLVCADGTMLSHSFFCADGTGRLTLAIDVGELDYGGQDLVHTGTWTVLGGGGAYESVTGSGEVSQEIVGGIEYSTAYTGHLEISD